MGPVYSNVGVLDIVPEVSELSSVIFILFKASRLHYFFLLISALLSLVQWFVEALHRVRFVLSVCLFVCFLSYGQGSVRW